jgi:deazaflavin-dependent oxidoreductase (nitroreductase family)
MAAAGSWNDNVIAEFRANGGKVGGMFEGTPLVLMHHTGRSSGKQYVAPAVYLPGGNGRIHVFASAAGAPAHPQWYANLVAAGRSTVEVGTETYPVTVTELTGEERDRIYAEQAGRFPNFAEYAEKTRGVRTIPVLALDRVAD